MLNRILYVLILAITMIIAPGAAYADNPWANSPYKGWADKQQIMPAARPRFGCTQPPASECSCCAGADIVKTKFSVTKQNGTSGYPEDEWSFLNPVTKKWEKVPNDIIHWGQPTPTGEAVLFIHLGKPRCFFPPQLVPPKILE